MLGNIPKRFLSFALICTVQTMLHKHVCTGLVLGLRPANGRRRYKVSSSVIVSVPNWNQPWCILSSRRQFWCVITWLIKYTMLFILTIHIKFVRDMFNTCRYIINDQIIYIHRLVCKVWRMTVFCIDEILISMFTFISPFWHRNRYML